MLVANIKKYKRLYTKYDTTENDNTAASSQLWTYSIPAGSLKVGDLIKICASGSFSYADNADLIYLETMLNASAEISDYFDPGATFSNRAWKNEVEILIKEIGATGDLDVKNQAMFWYNTYFNNVVNGWYTSVDLTAAYSVGMNSNANNARVGTKMSVKNVTVDLFRI